MSYVSQKINKIRKKILDKGENVDLEVLSAATYSDYGDLISNTTTIHEVKAIFNTYGLGRSYNPEGLIDEAKFSFFFSGDQTGVANNNIIVREDGERWKITKYFAHSLGGQTIVIEALTSQA
jgi:hypothetical protein